MSQKQNKSEKMKKYEQIEKEFKEFLLEYNKLKENNAYNVELTNKITKLMSKQKEIQTLLVELNKE
ncbi:MAG: hypothetical protein MAG458_01344 [Nitrosopumilus sp.]|nr:hypothetical protein [Nitrosopumilus sp.]